MDVPAEREINRINTNNENTVDVIERIWNNEKKRN